MKKIKAYYEIEPGIDGTKIIESLERAGRTCWKSEPAGDFEKSKAFVKMLIKKGHHSVLEHEKVTVRIITDRGVTHEIVRHRIASYSQESTRYCNYSKDAFGNEITFIDPPFWNTDSEVDEHKRMIMLNCLATIEESYLELIKLGASPQEARYLLPNGLKTEIVCTFNLREWRHFFKLRAAGESGKPHPQMLELTIPMLADFKKIIPVVFDDIEPMAL